MTARVTGSDFNDMSKLRCHISMSLDGFMAGPNQSEENPLGEGGEELHDWVVQLASWREVHGERRARGEREHAGPPGNGPEHRRRDHRPERVGPIGGGPWDEQWTGWWGENPPYHYPVFVVTHHPREPVEMQGGTTYHFVTDGIESRWPRPSRPPAGKDVGVWGGGDIVGQYLAAGLLDELELHVTPLLLGDGSRPFPTRGRVQLEQIRVVEAPGVTHLKYRVVT